MRHKSSLIGLAAAFSLPMAAAAQDAYVVGLTGALTGPPASTYAPAVDALRIYVERLNAAGGINGKKISLILEDDGAQPSKAAANLAVAHFGEMDAVEASEELPRLGGDAHLPEGGAGIVIGDPAGIGPAGKIDAKHVRKEGC